MNRQENTPPPRHEEEREEDAGRRVLIEAFEENSAQVLSDVHIARFIRLPDRRPHACQARSFGISSAKSESFKAWQKDLAKRAEKARTAGRELPVKLYQALYRPTEVSLQFIRWLRVGLTRPTCYRRAIEQLRPLMLDYL